MANDKYDEGYGDGYTDGFFTVVREIENLIGFKDGVTVEDITKKLNQLQDEFN